MSLEINKYLSFSKLHFSGWSLFFLYKLNVEYNYINEVNLLLFTNTFIYSSIGSLFSFLLYKLYKRINLLSKSVVKIIILIFSISFVFSFLWISTYFSFLHILFSNNFTFNKLKLNLLLDFSFFESFTLIMYSVLFFTFSLLKRYEEEKNKELRLKEKLESLNLKTFQNKLKPTVIKKTLELIKNKLEVDQLFAEELLNSLSELLRLILTNLKKDNFLIKDEIEALKIYITIYKAIKNEEIIFSTVMNKYELDRKVINISLFYIVSTLIDTLDEVNFPFSNLTINLKDKKFNLETGIIISKTDAEKIAIIKEKIINNNNRKELFPIENIFVFDESDDYLRIIFILGYIKNE